MTRPKTTLAFFFIIGLLAYFKAMNGDFIWDDLVTVVRNEQIRSFAYIGDWFTSAYTSGAGVTTSNLYRPLSTAAYALIYSVFGLHAFGYHLANLIIHTLNTYLVFSLFQKFNFKKMGCMLAALIFMLHPAQTEAVAHISGLPDILAPLFVLLGLNLFLKKNLKTVDYLKLCGLFILGLLAKELAIVLLPLMIVLLIYIWPTLSKEEKETRKLWLKVLAILACGYIFLRAGLLNFTDSLNLHIKDNAYTEDLNLRITTFISILPSYAKTLFLPIDLYFEKQFIAYPNILSFKGLFGTLVTAGGLVLSYKSLLKGSRNFFLGFFWFFAALLPVMGIVAVNASHADRWLYLPLVGLLILVPIIYERAIDKDIQKKLMIVFLIIAMLFGVRSFARNVQWADSFTFYENELKYNQNSARIYSLVGQLYFHQGDLQAAEASYLKGVSLDTQAMLPEIRYNLGNTYLQMRNLDGAVNQFFMAIEINPKFIDPYIALYNIGIAIHSETLEKGFLELIHKIERGESVDFNSEVAPLAG